MASRCLSILAISLMLYAAESRGEIHPYSDPLPYAGYVNDIGPVVEEALKRHGWRYEPGGEGGNYAASLSHKGFEVEVSVTTTNGELVVDVVRAYMADCAGDCADLRREAHVERWVANLRRTIALEITYGVRDHLMK